MGQFSCSRLMALVRMMQMQLTQHLMFCDVCFDFCFQVLLMMHMPLSQHQQF
jgi:hypothetical protein